MLIIIFLIFIISINLYAESKKEKPGIGQIILNDLRDVGQNFRHVFCNYDDFGLNDALMYTAVASGTALCMSFDEDMRRFALKNQSLAADLYFDIHNEFGSIRGMGVISGSTYLTGLFFDSKQTRLTGRLMFEALALSGLYVQAMKMTIKHSRPFTGDPSGQYNLFEWDNKSLSFPSGHATAVFSMATVFALRYDKWWSYAIGYTLGTGTAFARVYKDQHWLSDVFFGACLGTLSGIAVVKAEKFFSNKSENRDSSRAFSVNILPTGINFNYKL